MSYKLKFLPVALSEWKKLDTVFQDRFKTKLKNCLAAPCIPENNLPGYENHYKIRLRASNYRLVYEVAGQEVYVLGIVAANGNDDLVFKKHDVNRHILA